jgi:hypothetical protein
MLRGLRLAARSLARNPSFSAIVVLTLALGLGASTLIYSVLDGVLLKPLPYPDPDRIVRVFQVNSDGYDRVNLSHPNFEDLKAQTRSFSSFAVYEVITEAVVGGSEAARLEVGHVSREFDDAIGARPLLGRAFAAEEQAQGAPPAALISYRVLATLPRGHRRFCVALVAHRRPCIGNRRRDAARVRLPRRRGRLDTARARPPDLLPNRAQLSRDSAVSARCVTRPGPRGRERGRA